MKKYAYFVIAILFLMCGCSYTRKANIPSSFSLPSSAVESLSPILDKRGGMNGDGIYIGSVTLNKDSSYSVFEGWDNLPLLSMDIEYIFYLAQTYSFPYDTDKSFLTCLNSQKGKYKWVSIDENIKKRTFWLFIHDDNSDSNYVIEVRLQATKAPEDIHTFPISGVALDWGVSQSDIIDCLGPPTSISTTTDSTILTYRSKLSTACGYSDKISLSISNIYGLDSIESSIQDDIDTVKNRLSARYATLFSLTSTSIEIEVNDNSVIYKLKHYQ